MRAVLALAGLAAVGYGAYGWFTHGGANPVGQAAFLVILLAVHDFVVVPLVALTGAVLSRRLPEPIRTPVRVACAVSAAVTVVAVPFVIGAGRVQGNPSAFPQSYGRNLAIVVALVWLVAAAWAAARMRRRR